MNQFRRPAAAGLFYPSDPVKLKELISSLLLLSQPSKSINQVHGIVVPHAGYIYSGRTAGFAYNLIKDYPFSTVIIISPSHREYFSGISIYAGDGYSTPLGDVRINKEVVDKLIAGSKNIFAGIQGHREEHAVEVHIPFLQVVLNNFTIVPMVMGDQSSLFVNELADKIAQIYTEEMLIIASSDLSHFYDRNTAAKLDQVVEKRITENDYNNLMLDLESKRCEACGGGPIVVLLKALAQRNIRNTVILDRSDSGDVTHNLDEVVGYLSAAVYS